jgi:hypothetical protein
MAFEMNYTNGKGANYPQSYWRIGWFQTDRNGQRARTRLDCYFNEAAREANVEGNVLENRFYDINADDFTTVFETTNDIRQAIYDYVKDYTDMPSVEDENMLVSFFAAAIDS